MNDTRSIAEAAVRSSYGRLIAYLSTRTRDITAAEDALQDAFVAALGAWPETGIPTSPEAWLLTAARRKLIDQARRSETRRLAEPDLIAAIEEAEAMTNEESFGDDRLKLLFLCAHPAIDEAIRTPLMLQTILGLDASMIASAFLVAPEAMSQRLVRAKKKISAASISFELPPEDRLEERAGAVFDAIYAAFNAGYGAASKSCLEKEGLFLARLCTKLLPQSAEGWGLLALICYILSRREARRSNGAYAPLDKQDTKLWDRSLIEEGDVALATSAALRTPGRFQIEAAIQSAHMAGCLHGFDTREAVVRLYDRLIAISPSVGASTARAAALLNAGRANLAIAALDDSIDVKRVATYQPYWTTKAHILAGLGRIDEAKSAFDRAIGLSSDEAVRTFLRDSKARLCGAPR